MGFGKFVKKVVKKVTKPVTKAVGGVLGVQGAQPVEQAQAAPPPPPAAQVVEAPAPTDIQTDDEAQTESGRKKARAGGKKALSVARSSGGGINM